ncbi:MAG: recombination regulator RecX [Lachnospiraceae bacterium]|nr:recombination regulator RecX [Lachnospiraceae bacterium]
MERVNEIKKLSGGRCLVLLESGFQFPLYVRELSGYDLSEGVVIQKETITKIMDDVLKKRARLCAMHLLERMSRTEFQLREKLRQAYYPEQIIEDAIQYVKEYHYVDDLRYAIGYLENHSSAKSLRQMEQELYTKGVAKEVVAQAITESELPDEESQIHILLEKKHYDPSSTDRKEQKKLYDFLIRKGYSSSAVLCAINQRESSNENTSFD